MSETPPSGKPNYGSAIRVAQIIHWLHESPLGLSLEQLRDRLGVSDRTLARYIATLKESFDNEEGEPLVEVTRGGGSGRLRFRRKGVEMEGDAYELMSLFMALDLMAFLEGTFLMEGAQEVIERLQERLRKHGHQSSLVLKDFKKKFFHWTEAPKDYSDHNDLLRTLVNALVLQKRMEIDYKSPNKAPKTHQIMPLSLLMYKRGLYLVARKAVDGPEKTRDITFAVERIVAARASQEGFSYPYDYDPQARFKGTFGLIQGSDEEDICLRFDQIVTQNVKARKWHSSQTESALEDGRVDLCFRLQPGQEFLAWVLSYGHYVEVIEPESLRERVAERLREALGKYES